jgi:hypothetical protein
MALSPELEKAVIRFFTYHPPERVNKHLRILLMDGLANGIVTEQRNFQDILFDLEGIFELMDIVTATEEEERVPTQLAPR